MKNTILKFLYILIEILVIVALTVFVYNNLDKSAEFFCALMKKTYTTNLTYIVFAFFTTGAIAGYIFNELIKLKLSQRCDAYQKRYENTSIQKDTDKAKIATLEAKIATLEAALESALKNN